MIKCEIMSRTTHAKRTPTLASNSLLSLWASLRFSFSILNCAAHTYTPQTQTHHGDPQVTTDTEGNRGTNEGGLDRQRRGTLVHYNRYSTHKRGKQGKEDVPYTVNDNEGTVLYSYFVWMSYLMCKGRVYCTFTPKTGCNLSSKEHQGRALTAAWKEQDTASLTVGRPSNSSSIYHVFCYVFILDFFSPFSYSKIHFSLTFLDVCWALILLCCLCFRNVPILLWYFILYDLAKRKEDGNIFNSNWNVIFLRNHAYYVLWWDGNFHGAIKKDFARILENGCKVQYLKKRWVLFYILSFGIKAWTSAYLTFLKRKKNRISPSIVCTAFKEV